MSYGFELLMARSGTVAGGDERSNGVSGESVNGDVKETAGSDEIGAPLCIGASYRSGTRWVA